MNKKQKIVVLSMVVLIALLLGLHEVWLMYKQPNVGFYEKRAVFLYGLGPFDKTFLGIFLKFQLFFLAVVLIAGGFLIYKFRGKKKRLD